MKSKSNSKSEPLFHSLEHQILRQIKELDLHDLTLLLCVSGGMDSMTMMRVLKRLNAVLKMKLHVVHIHHGGASAFRNRALKLVANESQKLQLPFSTNPRRKTAGRKESEAFLREYRMKELAAIASDLHLKNKKFVYVKAHHLDDLLETRLIRLVRGVSGEGLVAMKLYDGQNLRPFLSLTTSEIRTLAKYLKVKWIDDPSNQNTDPLRNWMRQKWLPALDKKTKGGRVTLARSLENLTIQNSDSRWVSVIDRRGILLSEFLPLTHQDKMDCLFYFMRHMKMKDYGFRHAKEILRRLDNDRGDLMFPLLKHEWSINAGHISVRRL